MMQEGPPQPGPGLRASQPPQEQPSGTAKQALHPVQRLVFGVLCGLVFATGLSTTGTVLWNASVISLYELVFVLVYVVLSRHMPQDAESGRTTKILLAAVALWMACITISFVASPYDVAAVAVGRLRYLQTVSHVVFFIAVRDFFGRVRLPIAWLLIAIPASCFVVALMAAYLSIGVDGHDPAISEQWFSDPPFNTHIRHSGYQVAAGVSVLTTFFISGSCTTPAKIPLLLVLIALCTFLIWMGGRASVLSVVVAFALLAVTLRVKGAPSRSLWLAFSLSVAAGLVLSEWLAVFDWNGVVDLATRTAEAVAAEDLNQLGTGRFAVWLSSWESVREHLIFGLGPNGYWFMPNRIYGVQPHSFLVQFLVEWGLAGSLLFLGLLLYGFWRGFLAHVVRARGGLDIASLSAGTMIVALTVHGLVDGTYYHPQPSLYLALGFAVWTLPRRPGRASVVAEAR